MKRREKFLLAFFIAVIISLISYVIIEIYTYYEELRSIKTSNNTYTEQQVEAYSKLLEEYIEGNYKKDYRQLAINIMAFEVSNGDYVFEYYDENYVQHLAEGLRKYIEENYRGNYYKLAEEDLLEIARYTKEELIKDNKEYSINNTETIIYFIITCMGLSIMIFAIITIEYKNIKQYLKANINLILILILYSILSYIFDEIILMISNNETLLDYWNNSFKHNIVNGNYWISCIIIPSEIFVNWIIFIIGNLIKNSKNIKQIITNKKDN